MIKPILFNTEMVRAILEGLKTVTRRVVKPQPPNAHDILDFDEEDNSFDFLCGMIADNCFIDFAYTAKAPYRPGDILYVRETFRIDYLSNIPGSGRIHYKADDTYADFSFSPARYEMMRRAQLKPGWRPNENMPHEAARIFLRVTDVRVERVQDIDDDGVVAEGLNIGDPFDELWDSTIKPADRALYGWDANPWVWVIEFERITREEALPHA